MNKYNKNLDFFKNNLANMYNTIISTTQNISEKNNKNNIAEKIKNFINSPTAFFVAPQKFYIEYNGDKHKEQIHKIHNKYTKLIEDKIPKQNTNLQEYHNHLDSIPLLIIFGIGDAKHIEQLIDLIDIKNLIIIDIDYCDFKYSMNYSDWEKIIKYFQRDGYSLELQVSQDIKTLSHIILNEIEEKYKPYSYYIPYFISNDNNVFLEIIKTIEIKYHLLFNGWGFYDDEKLGFEHSIKNIKKDFNIVSIDNNKVINYDAFIIGSGPSIDSDIAYIKKHQNNVVIFSCGTALKVLEENNIIPDYHIEIERTDFIINVLKNTTSEKFKKNIDFIGLSAIAPEVFNYFKSKNIFFKQMDIIGATIPNYIKTIDHIGPTVINAGISIVSLLNFKNIYLFGTDMGYKDEKKHHSINSAYNQKGSSVNRWKPETNNVLLPSNFDKNKYVYSISVYINCKKNVETCIRHHKKLLKKEINYFNCSDGAFIEGTTPLNSKEIIINNDLEKSDILQKIKSNFIKNSNSIREDININLEHQKIELFMVIDNIIKNIEKTQINHSFKIYFELVNIIFAYFPKTKKNEKNTIYSSLLIGDLQRIFLIIYSHSLMSKNIEETFIFIDHSLKIIIEFLNFIKIDIENISTKVD